MNKFFTKNKVKYIKNTLWMIIEKIFRMGIVLLINIMLARYLGIEEFGYLSYSLALLSTMMVFTHLGLAGLVIKELNSKNIDNTIIMGTVFYMKMMGALVGFLIILSINIHKEISNSVHFHTLLLISLCIFFKPFGVIESWFISQVEAKYISISSTLSLIVSSIIKILFLLFMFTTTWVSLAYLVESFLMAAILLLIYYKKTSLNMFDWKFSLKLAKNLLSKSWMIMIGSFFAVIYLKSDQIMLKLMINDSAVGIYSVASSLSEVWYFLPSLIVTSLFPKIIEYKKENIINYYKRLQQLINMLFIIALVIAIVVNLLSTKVIILLYGNEYVDSGLILSIHIWSGLFIFMREVFSKWIIVEDLLQFSIITHGLGMISNILLNIILIPKYGAIGAALATLVSYSTSSYFALLFFKKTRIMFIMMTKGIISPINYLFRRGLK